MTVVSDIASRLFYVFRNSPNVTNMNSTFAVPYQDSEDAMDYLLANWSIDDAEGDQLDKLSGLIGVKRPPLQETKLFTLIKSGQTQSPDLGFADDSDPTVTVGGYMGNSKGFEAVDGGDMSDADFRFLIRQKAASFRTKMTPEALWLYLLAFGARCDIDDDTLFEATITMHRHQDFDNWTRNYITTRGFKPAGIKIQFDGNLVDKDAI